MRTAPSKIYTSMTISVSLTCPDEREPIRGKGPYCSRLVNILLEVRGGRLSATLFFPCISRLEVQLAIVRRIFQEPGWGIAEDKIQLGWQLHLLGSGISTMGDGALFVLEVKRSGLLQYIAAQRLGGVHKGVVPMELVEKLVGRLTHVAIVAPEGNASLQPL